MKFLSYVGCDGNQAIDTGFKPNQDTRVIMDCFLNNVATSLFGLFGARDTNSATAANQFISWVATAGEAIRSDYFGTSVTADVTMHSKRLIVDHNRNICTADGVSAINTYKAGQCANTMYIGAVNNVGSFGFGMYGKIYGCKIYDNNVLVRDYVPAMTDDGVAGLWDKVEEVFYQSVNSAFTAGPVKSIGMIRHLFTGLENGKAYYAKVFTVNPKGRVNNRADLPFASAIPSAFPAEPSAYELINTYTSATTFTAPEDGWYQIELFGASGNGGTSSPVYQSRGSSERVDGETVWYKAGASGGGGGSGGYARSIVKLNEGDTIVFTSPAIGSIAAIYINSSIDIYANMLASSGGNGGNGSCNSNPNGLYDVAAGSGGSAGTVSGGTEENVSGNPGSAGTRFYQATNYIPAQTGGPGGAAVKGGNAGGKGGDTYASITGSTKPGAAGKTAFMKIYRGNTNVA